MTVSELKTQGFDVLWNLRQGEKQLAHIMTLMQAELEREQKAKDDKKPTTPKELGSD